MLSSLELMFDLNNDASVAWWEWPASIVVWWVVIVAVGVVGMLVMATAINTADGIFNRLESWANGVLGRPQVGDFLPLSDGHELSVEDRVEDKRKAMTRR